MTKIKYLLSFNRYSRNGKKTNCPKGIVVHHAENESYGAIETRNYFENLKHGKNAVYYSTHYIIGFEGEVIHCVPEEEVAYHRGNNPESSGVISITYCCKNKSSVPTPSTVLSLVELVRDISMRYGFDVDKDFLRHYDITGIKCPQYYAENEKSWYYLKQEILNEIAILEAIAEKSSLLIEKASSATGLERKLFKEVLGERSRPSITMIYGLVCEIAKKDGT